MSNEKLMGPPEKGPTIRITGKGLDLLLVVNSESDREIVQMFLDAAERRRFGKQVTPTAKAHR